MKRNLYTRNEAFAAVIVPYGLTNAGFNLANCSLLDTRMPLSVSIVFSMPFTENEHFF